MATALQNGPITTVYAKNLEESIPIPTLTESLEEIFGEFGTVLEIVAKKNLKAKGQAFIVFDDPSAAATAIEEVNGFELFGKPMELALAKTRSDATVRMQEGENGLDNWKKARLAEKEKKQATEQAAQQQQGKLKRPAVNDAQAGVGGLAQRPAKTAKGAGLKGTSSNASTMLPDNLLPPNKTLFIRNIPASYDADGLSRIFSRFDGFREVRTVPGRAGIAFVEYEAEQGAISAKEATAGMMLGDEGTGIVVTYQRA